MTWQGRDPARCAGVDEVGHQFGPGSQTYTDALVNIDNVIGRWTDAFDRAGMSDDTFYVLMSDHGMAPVSPETRIDIVRWLRDERDLSVRARSIDLESYEDRFDLMDSYDAVASVDAGRVAMVHLRSSRGWFHRPPPEEVLAWITTAP